MSRGARRRGTALGTALGIALTMALSSAAPAAAPERVLSMNLCTDQMALLLAAPGQLISVSALAQDPAHSAMAEAARALPANHGLAEEIWLMRPDLVLAGRYTAQETVRLLTRMGVRVEVFAPETDLEAVPASLRRMGAILGREAEAEAMAADFAARLAALAVPDGAPRPRAALYAADGYTSGSASLSGRILAAAGYDNVADAAGIGAGGYLTLEELVLSAPDLVVESRRLPGHSRAEALLDHPALTTLKDRADAAVLSDADWVCGTPQVLSAIAALKEARR